MVPRLIKPTCAAVQALDNIRREGLSGGGMYQEYDDEVVPHALRRQVSVYEAGRALLAFITPGYDEISKVWPLSSKLKQCRLMPPCRLLSPI